MYTLHSIYYEYEFSNESRSYVIDFVKNMSVEDMICVLELIEDEGIDRGTIGQSIEILFKNIEKEAEKLINIINSDDNDYYVCYYAE